MVSPIVERFFCREMNGRGLYNGETSSLKFNVEDYNDRTKYKCSQYSRIESPNIWHERWACIKYALIEFPFLYLVYFFFLFISLTLIGFKYTFYIFWHFSSTTNGVYWPVGLVQFALGKRWNWKVNKKSQWGIDFMLSSYLEAQSGMISLLCALNAVIVNVCLY